MVNIVERENTAPDADTLLVDQLRRGDASAFERLFEREGKEFARFHRAVKALAALPRDERRRALGAE